MYGITDTRQELIYTCHGTHFTTAAEVLRQSWQGMPAPPQEDTPRDGVQAYEGILKPHAVNCQTGALIPLHVALSRFSPVTLFSY